MTNEIEITKEVVKNFKNINTSITHINRGGCGIFAQNLYTTLTKLGVNARICVFAPNLSEFKKKLRGEYHDSWGAGSHHIVLKVGRYYVDSNGMHPTMTACVKYAVNLTACYGMPFKMLKYENEHDSWNPQFNRAQIPSIERRLKRIYTKLNKHLVVK